MSRQCRFCRAELPDEANFCPYCAKSQTEKENIKIPVPKRRKILILIGILILALIVIHFVRYQTQPKTVDNGSAEAVYQHGSGTWHFLLRNSINDDFHWQTPQDEYYRMCTAGTDGAVPLQLYVYDEDTGHSVAEEFLTDLESSEVKAVSRDGANVMQCSEPAPDAGFSLAAQKSDVVFDTDCGTNDITWTIRLKNRDTIVLHEVIRIETNPELSYSYEDTPISTTGELQTLLEQIKKEVADPNTVVNIYLAPTVYEGDLDILDRAVNLIGTADENGSTVFRGCITIDNRNPLYATFENITFEGSGTGIYATEGFMADFCTFNGKDTGVLGAEGSWPIVYGCRFENCGIGLHFNSENATMRNVYNQDLTFVNNETGILLEKVPGTDILYYIDCTFEGNGCDIENLAGNEISYQLDIGN